MRFLGIKVPEELISLIKSFHGRGREPLVLVAAEKVGMNTQSMRVLLKNRQGAQGRYFAFDPMDRIEAMLKAGAI